MNDWNAIAIVELDGNRDRRRFLLHCPPGRRHGVLGLATPEGPVMKDETCQPLDDATWQLLRHTVATLAYRRQGAA
ncbi:MAG: hypothetical protein R2708_17175 [Vicinamibacterales bacterium]